LGIQGKSAYWVQEVKRNGEANTHTELFTSFTGSDGKPPHFVVAATRRTEGKYYYFNGGKALSLETDVSELFWKPTVASGYSGQYMLRALDGAEYEVVPQFMGVTCPPNPKDAAQECKPSPSHTRCGVNVSSARLNGVATLRLSSSCNGSSAWLEFPRLGTLRRLTREQAEPYLQAILNSELDRLSAREQEMAAKQAELHRRKNLPTNRQAIVCSVGQSDAKGKNLEMFVPQGGPSFEVRVTYDAGREEMYIQSTRWMGGQEFELANVRVGDLLATGYKSNSGSENNLYVALNRGNATIEIRQGARPDMDGRPAYSYAGRCFKGPAI